MSRFDVIVPCYKYGHFLRDCVHSVLTQQGVELRVLILDDASPDSTPQVATDLARRDDRITYRRHDANQGHVNTYNEGFEWATSEYVVLLSADDFLAPGALRRTADVMDAHSQVGLVYGGQILFSQAAPPQAASGEVDLTFDLFDGAEFLETACATASNPVTTATAMMRTSLLRSIGGFDVMLPHSGDMEMWLRLAGRGAVARIDAVQAHKRIHRSNMQLEYVGGHLGDLKERCEVFESLFRKDGALIADRDRLRALALRRLAEQAFWAASRAVEHGDCSGSHIC